MKYVKLASAAAVFCAVCSIASASPAITLTLSPSASSVDQNQPFTVDIFATSATPMAAVWFDVLFDSTRLSAATPVSLSSQLSFFPETGTLGAGVISFVGGGNIDGFGGSSVPFKVGTISFSSLDLSGLANIQLGWTTMDESALVGGPALTEADVSFVATSVEVLAPPYLAGDCNKDLFIDGGDLATLGLNWSPGGSGKTWEEGDFNGDGAVDGGDLAALGLNWAPGGYSVPEPASLALLCMGSLALLRRRR